MSIEAVQEQSATTRKPRLASDERQQTEPETQLAQAWPFSVSVIIPARNEAQSIGRVIEGVLTHCPQAEIIVVDDASTDDTAQQSAAAGARVISRPYNIGNGAGVKTGIRAATGDVIVIIDADGQHDPADLPKLLNHIGPYDMVIGSRDREGQENWVRWIGNNMLNRLGSYLMEREMQDLTSGFRAMRRELILEFIHLLPNQYSWPTTSALAFVKAGYHVRFEPIKMYKRQSGQSRQKLFRNGVRFTLIILRIVSLFAPLRVYFPVAITMFVLGIISFLISFFITDAGRGLYIPNSALGLFIGSVIVFMFGLLAEQIAGLRFRGPDR